jgi:hypothetical protein
MWVNVQSAYALNILYKCTNECFVRIARISRPYSCSCWSSGQLRRYSDKDYELVSTGMWAWLQAGIQISSSQWSSVSVAPRQVSRCDFGGNASELWTVRISVGVPDIVTEVFHGSSRFFQENAGILPQIIPRLILCTSFQIKYLLNVRTIVRYTLGGLTAMLNEP